MRGYVKEEEENGWTKETEEKTRREKEEKGREGKCAREGGKKRKEVRVHVCAFRASK